MGDEGCKQIIEEVWRGDSGGVNMEEVMRKITGCSMKLTSWNK